MEKVGFKMTVKTLKVKIKRTLLWEWNFYLNVGAASVSSTVTYPKVILNLCLSCSNIFSLFFVFKLHLHTRYRWHLTQSELIIRFLKKGATTSRTELLLHHRVMPSILLVSHNSLPDGTHYIPGMDKEKHCGVWQCSEANQALNHQVPYLLPQSPTYYCNHILPEMISPSGDKDSKRTWHECYSRIIFFFSWSTGISKRSPYSGWWAILCFKQWCGVWFSI